MTQYQFVAVNSGDELTTAEDFMMQNLPEAMMAAFVATLKAGHAAGAIDESKLADPTVDHLKRQVIVSAIYMGCLRILSCDGMQPANETHDYLTREFTRIFTTMSIADTPEDAVAIAEANQQRTKH